MRREGVVEAERWGDEKEGIKLVDEEDVSVI